MEFRGRALLVVLWIATVVLVGAIASAQSRQLRPDTATAPVISGADIGFRPDGWQGKARTGTFVVRINGEWVEAIPGATVRPATTR
jgi:hypothetical protein